MSTPTGIWRAAPALSDFSPSLSADRYFAHSWVPTSPSTRVAVPAHGTNSSVRSRTEESRVPAYWTRRFRCCQALLYADDSTRPSAKSLARRPIGHGAGTALPTPAARTHAAGKSVVRVRRCHATRILPHRLNHFAALRVGGRRFGGDFCRRQRGAHRGRVVHGRRDHPEPGHRPECRIRVPVDRPV